jgi:hypothetical protein
MERPDVLPGNRVLPDEVVHMAIGIGSAQCSLRFTNRMPSGSNPAVNEDAGFIPGQGITLHSV